VKWLPLIPLLFLLCQCGSPSPPRCDRVPRESRAPAASLVAEAGAAWTQITRKSTAGARDRYNRAVSRLFDQLRCGSTNWDRRAEELGTAIDGSQLPRSGLRFRDLDALIPASQIALKGIGKRHLDPGIGIPVVGWKADRKKTRRAFKFAPPTGTPLNLTVVLDFSSAVPKWRLLSAAKEPIVTLDQTRERLAVDWSAAAALYWHLSDLDDGSLLKLFLPTRFTDHTGLIFATPYTPEKIPVVLIHGLNSSPGTFKTLYNDLMGQKWFRDNYQVLVFSYPTGIGWPYNAAKFRRQVRLARDYAAEKGSLAQWDKMVIVSHSMGGVITRASLVQPGDRFYRASYDRPLADLRVSDSTRHAIKAVRLYDPLKSPARVIFMAVPHRGSPLADRPFFHWLGSIVRLPKTLTIDLATATLEEIGRALQNGGETRPPLTSFGTLTPTYRPYQAINASPFRPGLIYHSIIGDRGKGNGRDSSDGIVPYWSSHLEGARSEKIVPAGHTLTGHPETLQEVSRILKVHLGRPTTTRTPRQ